LRVRASLVERLLRMSRFKLFFVVAWFEPTRHRIDRWVVGRADGWASRNCQHEHARKSQRNCSKFLLHSILQKLNPEYTEARFDFWSEKPL
jgi:hypothetical protein